MGNKINTFFTNIGTELAGRIPQMNQTIMQNFINTIQTHPPIHDFTQVSMHNISVLIRDLKPMSGY